MSQPDVILEELDCLTPTFRNQTTLDKPGLFDLGDGNSLLVVHNALFEDEIDDIVEEELKLKREQPSIRGHVIPRYEVCFSPDGKSFKYSGIFHHTIKYPEYLLEVSELMLYHVEKKLDNKYTKLSNGISLHYSRNISNGGGIRAHSDVNPNWGLIGILSLGQNRWMRFRHKETKEYTNVKLRHNSLVFMHGESFQKDYTHQIDPLHDEDVVGDRLSINIRYTK